MNEPGPEEPTPPRSPTIATEARPSSSAPAVRRAPRSVVVIGAGLAGFRTVAALRSQGFAGHITVLGAEGIAPYDRPPLSKHLRDRTEPVWLADDLGVDALGLADEVHLARPARALVLRADGVTVQTDDGPVTADAAVLATGSSAVRIPGAARSPGAGRAPGDERIPDVARVPDDARTAGAERPFGAERSPDADPDEESALALHTAADAARLRPLVRPGARLVIVGAGWIGAEVAGVAAAAGAHVTVVEALDTPLTAALGPAVGALTAPWYAAAGVDLLTGVRVAHVGADSVLLSDGRTLPANAVLVAIGARPSSEWLAGALPLEPDGSVLVDASYAPVGGPRTVRVVGDLALRQSARHGLVPGGHWDGALRGPDVAVRSLLDPDSADPPEDLAPYVFSTQLGHELALYGHPHPDDDVVVRGTAPATVDAATGWTVLWFRPGTEVLTAVLAVDRPRDVAAARRLFTGPGLPSLDRARAADTTVPLRSAAIA